MLASTVFCQELDIGVARVNAAIEAADAANFNQDRQEYINAVEFYDRETGFFSKSIVAIGSACTNLTNEANGYADALNAAVRAEGGTGGVFAPGYNPSAPIDWPTFASVGLWTKVIIGAGALGVAAYFISTTGVLSRKADHSRRRRRR